MGAIKLCIRCSSSDICACPGVKICSKCLQEDRDKIIEERAAERKNIIEKHKKLYGDKQINNSRNNQFVNGVPKKYKHLSG